MRHLTPFLVGAAAFALATGAQAQTHTAYIGGAHVDINSSAPPLTGGPAVPAPGAQLNVGDADTVLIGWIRHFGPDWSGEFAVGLPPKHKVYGDGFIAPFGQISSVKQVAPTLFVNYHFGELGGRFAPFVGIGINYTRFSGAHSTPSGDAASGGPTTIKLSDSTGLAAHAGVNVRIDKAFSIIACVSVANVKSNVTATTTTPVATTVRTTTIDFRPTVFGLTLGYSY
jgi:outer membrane protein